MATLDELKAHMVAHGLNASIIFRGSQPDEPDIVFVLYEYPGNPPEYIQESFDPQWENPQIQVVARARSYDVAREMAQQAWSIFASITNADLSGVRYRSVRPNSSPFLIGRDPNDRLRVGFNMSVEKEAVIVVSS